MSLQDTSETASHIAHSSLEYGIHSNVAELLSMPCCDYTEKLTEGFDVNLVCRALK